VTTTRILKYQQNGLVMRGSLIPVKASIARRALGKVTVVSSLKMRWLLHFHILRG
jgi:hypothetical protein